MSLMHSNFDCPVCGANGTEIHFFGFSQCNHPLCGLCVIKLEKFSSETDNDYDYYSNCVICKQKLNKIIFSNEIRSYEEYDPNELIRRDRNNRILFASKSSKEFYDKTLEISCPRCGLLCDSVEEMIIHLNDHRLRYCELCVHQKKCLQSELEAMTDNDYHQHRSKTHPKCRFCETRYYDETHLLKHVKDKHFLCDICHRNQGVVVYSTQNELLKHYLRDHFVCEICRSSNNINVFESDYQLKLHKVGSHSHSLITEDLVSVTYGDRDNLSYGARRRGRENADFFQETPAEQPPQSIPTMNCEQEFPRLGAGASDTNTPYRHQQQLGTKSLSTDHNDARTAFSRDRDSENSSSKSKKPLERNSEDNNIQSMSKQFAISVKKSAGQLNNEDFPCLSSELRPSVSNRPIEFSRLSINNTTAATGPIPQKPHIPIEEDFPTLPSGSGSKPSIAVNSLWKPSSKKQSSSARFDSAVIEPQRPTDPITSSRQKLPTELDFPSLSSSSSKPLSGPTSAPATVSKIGAWGTYSVPVDKRAERRRPQPEKFVIENALESSKDNATGDRKKFVKKKKSIISSSPPASPPIPSIISHQSVSANNEYIPQSSISSTKSDPLVLVDSEQFSQMKSTDDINIDGNKDHVNQSIMTVNNTTAATNLRSPPVISSESDFPSLQTPRVNHQIDSRKNDNKNRSKNKANKSKPINSPPKSSSTIITAKSTQVEQSAAPVVSLMDVAMSVTNKRYTPLPDADERNEKLAELLLGHLPGDLAARFLMLSNQYRTRQLSVKDYLDQLETAEFAEHSSLIAQVLPMMCSLLPDIPLQRSLMGGMPKIWIRDLRECVKCEQVLLKDDLTIHCEMAH